MVSKLVLTQHGVGLAAVIVLVAGLMVATFLSVDVVGHEMTQTVVVSSIKLEGLGRALHPAAGYDLASQGHDVLFDLINYTRRHVIVNMAQDVDCEIIC